MWIQAFLKMFKCQELNCQHISTNLFPPVKGQQITITNKILVDLLTYFSCSIIKLFIICLTQDIFNLKVVVMSAEGEPFAFWFQSWHQHRMLYFPGTDYSISVAYVLCISYVALTIPESQLHSLFLDVKGLSVSDKPQCDLQMDHCDREAQSDYNTHLNR